MQAAIEQIKYEEDFIKKAEVARRLKRPVRTITNWMRRGWIPYYKIGRAVNFKWSEVEAELSRQCHIFSPPVIHAHTETLLTIPLTPSIPTPISALCKGAANRIESRKSSCTPLSGPSTINSQPSTKSPPTRKPRR